MFQTKPEAGGYIINDIDQKGVAQLDITGHGMEALECEKGGLKIKRRNSTHIVFIFLLFIAFSLPCDPSSFCDESASKPQFVSDDEGFGADLIDVNDWRTTQLGEFFRANYVVEQISGDHGNFSTVGTLAYIINQILNDKTTIFLTGEFDYRISTDLKVPENITLYFENGARLNPNSGVTVTLSTPENVIAQPNQQIITGDGTVSFSQGGRESICWRGGAGDDAGTGNGTDNSTPLTNALSGSAPGHIIYFPGTESGKGYYLDSGVSLPTSHKIKIDFQGNTIYSGLSSGNLFTIHTDSSEIKHDIENGFLETIKAQDEAGTAFYIEDSGSIFFHRIKVSNFDKAFHQHNNSRWCENNTYDNVKVSGNTYGWYFNKDAGANSQSMATTTWINCGGNTTDNSQANAYIFYLDQVSLYRSRMLGFHAFPRTENAYGFYFDGTMTGVAGFISVEGNNSSGSVGVYFGANVSNMACPLDIQEIRSVTTEIGIAGSVSLSEGFSGFRGFANNGGYTFWRRTNTQKPVISIADLDETLRLIFTFASGNRPVIESPNADLRIRIDSDSGYRVDFINIAQDDLGLLRGRFELKPGIIIDGTTSPSVKNYSVITLSNAGSTNIETFDDMPDGSVLVVKHANTNSTLIHESVTPSVKLFLSGSANYTGQTNATHIFWRDGNRIREISRITP